jgi:hypothetical protein
MDETSDTAVILSVDSLESAAVDVLLSAAGVLSLDSSTVSSPSSCMDNAMAAVVGLSRPTLRIFRLCFCKQKAHVRTESRNSLQNIERRAVV